MSAGPPIRAAIYARYSTDLQRVQSIEDQVRVCRDLADRLGAEVTAVFADTATSGSHLVRHGLQQLLDSVRYGRVEVVIAEALDRLSRDMEDVAGLYKQVTFQGAVIHTVSEGRISELHVGLNGTMNALFIKQLAEKTHRGLRGRVEAGRSGGGNCYGYEVVREATERGQRRIATAQADIVRRIFRDYANGLSPRTIAQALNAEAVPGPRGRGWDQSTINGNRSRGTGILNNELYIGRLVWNRQRFVRDPDTRRRVARANGADKLIVTEVPELAGHSGQSLGRGEGAPGAVRPPHPP
jgi:site-specific DNA recombinase